MFQSPIRFAQSALAAGSMAATLASAALADQYVGGDLKLVLDEDEGVEIFAADVTATGQVRGDVAVIGVDVRLDLITEGQVRVLGHDIELDGLVDDKVFLAGADIRVGAELSDDLSIAGADVILDGAIAGDAMIAGLVVVLTPDSVISGSSRLGARKLYLEGRLEDRVSIGAREVRISGVILGQVDIRAQEVIIEPDARIEGELTVRSPDAPQIAEGARVESVNYIEYHFEDRDVIKHDMKMHFPIGVNDFVAPWAIGGVLAANVFLLGLLASALSPRGVNKIVDAFRRRPWVSGLSGLVMLALLPVLTPTLFLLLVLTVIGIPLAFLLIFALPIMLFLAFVFGGIVIGDLALNHTGKPAGFGLRAGSFLAVIVVIALLSMTPFLTWLLSMIVFCIGLGAWTLAIFARTAPVENMPAEGS